MKEIDPKTTNRAQQFEIWKNAPNPMLVFVKKMDVTNLIKISRKKHLKFNMLLDYCIGKAAVCQKEFYLLPIGDKLMQFDKIAINTIVKNHTGEASSCDIEFTPDLNEYNLNYLKYTNQVANSCIDRDLSKECMVIGTSAIVDTELEFAGGMYSGIYNNPFIIWGRYSKHFFKYYLNISFQFHHAQMDGMHAARFLNNLQEMIRTLRVR
jgi:chloramphenicol O-acetyltransferase type A